MTSRHSRMNNYYLSSFNLIETIFIYYDSSVYDLINFDLIPNHQVISTNFSAFNIAIYVLIYSSSIAGSQLSLQSSYNSITNLFGAHLSFQIRSPNT